LSLREPNKRMSTGLPSTNALFIVPALVPSRLLPPVRLVGDPSSAPPVGSTNLLLLSYSIVLRERSFPLKSSSLELPFLLAKLLTNPWILSMSCTCRFIYFYNTLMSLSISIFKL
jgi:hypothetical protein